MIFTKKKRWEYIESFLIYGGTTITILNIGAIMANFGVIPKLAVFNLMYVSSAVIKSNELSLRMSNEPALIFILPYMITMLYSTKTLSKPKDIAYMWELLRDVHMRLSADEKLSKF